MSGPTPWAPLPPPAEPFEDALPTPASNRPDAAFQASDELSALANTLSQDGAPTPLTAAAEVRPIGRVRKPFAKSRSRLWLFLVGIALVLGLIAARRRAAVAGRPSPPDAVAMRRAVRRAAGFMPAGSTEPAGINPAARRQQERSMSADITDLVKASLIRELESLRDAVRDLAAPLDKRQFWTKPLKPGNSFGHSCCTWPAT